MNKRIKPTPPQHLLLEMFSYDILSGILVWRPRPKERFPTEQGWRVFNSKHVGKAAGAKVFRPDGSPVAVKVGINQKDYLASRLIWAFVYGSVPLEMEVDHINRNPHDNRLSNLRLVTPLGNILNRGANKNNTSGLRGVAYDQHREKFTARIMVNYQNLFIGRYDTKGMAAVARAKAELRYHGYVSLRR